MTELSAGANRALPTGTLTLRVPGPYDLSLLITGDDNRVTGDADFVFFNQTTAPGVLLRDATTAVVDPPRLRRGATRVTLAVSPADTRATLGSLPTPTLIVTTHPDNTAARFTPPPVTRETVLLLAEIYLRNGIWKIRALGQGYADGLAGIARDFGVDVIDEPTPPPLPAPEYAPIPIPGATPFTAPPSTPSAPSAPSPATPTYTPPGGGANPFTPGASPLATPPTPPTPAAPPAPSSLDPLRAEVITLTNAARAAHGLPPLAAEPRLTASAQAHSADMAARDYFEHDSLDGRKPADRIRAAGYAYSRCAENIAAGQPTPADVVDGWMNSPGHRANILTPELTQIGIGIAYGGSYRIYWTQNFGTPMPDLPPGTRVYYT
ncbi:CAP domain-containing protein [Yinghuangia seranimata]|uniref:CAP domain-containing protein n=1 Tax=Yinghuangia seranimata TaxID=408067 RepID=UPI00248BBFB5|nr:CAP domain-containing protein [Yinghuangia seranimata]MDI2130033.1 CAP domain-containing protein [Yinghuangia seranimata]